MAKQITLLFLLLAVAGGVASGTPLHAPTGKMMTCCDKAKSKDKSLAAEAARLCCAVNCSDSTPVPSGTSLNFSPSNIAVSKSIAEQIAALFPTRKVRTSQSFQHSHEIFRRAFQPKYVQHNSFLI